MKFESLYHRIYYHRPTSLMDIICKQLHEIATTGNEMDLYNSTMYAVFPECAGVETATTWQISDADKLHEVIIRIQIAATKRSKLAKFCKKVAPFVIQAREDKRADRICAAFTGEVNRIHTLTSATTPVSDAPTDDNNVSCDTRNSLDEWLSANIVVVRAWLTNKRDGDEDCVYDIDLYLASHGLLDLLKEYVANGCCKSSHATREAAIGGHLETLQWLLSNGYDNYYSMRSAIEGGHLDIVQWLYQNENYHEQSMAWCAAKHGHLHVLKWLLEQPEVVMGSSLFIGAAYHGNVNIIEYLHEIKCDYDRYASIIATNAGHIEFVKWLVTHGYELSPDILVSAIRAKHVHIANYLLELGIKFNEHTANVAISAGYKLLLA